MTMECDTIQGAIPCQINTVVDKPILYFNNILSAYRVLYVSDKYGGFPYYITYFQR